MSSLIGIVLLIALIGLVVWLLTTYIPMPEQIKQLIIIFTVIVILLWLLQQFGLISGAPSISLK